MLDQVVDVIVDEIEHLVEPGQTVGVVVLDELQASAVVYQLGRRKCARVDGEYFLEQKQSSALIILKR